MSPNVIKDGIIIDFDESKIALAIQKAFEATAWTSYDGCATEEEQENYRKFVRIMAEFDWPAFLEYDPDLHSEVISCVEAGDAEGISQALYNHFGPLFLKELEERFEESEVIHPERLPAIREAFLLYQLGYYYGAVAILVTQYKDRVERKLYEGAIDSSHYVRNHLLQICKNGEIGDKPISEHIIDIMQSDANYAIRDFANR